MNSSGGGHLAEGDLLRLIDGEMPEAAIPAARAHIEACWTCRAQFQEIETAIGEYVRYQKATDPLLPPPPNAWAEL
jgi:anti-sigma factor RsiW